MKRANVQECSAIKTHVDDNVSILATEKASTSSNNKASTSNSGHKLPDNPPASNPTQQLQHQDDGLDAGGLSGRGTAK